MNHSGTVSLNYLDKIPDKIYQRLITHQYRLSFSENKHSLQQRAQGVLAIRDQLLMGESVDRSLLVSWLDENLIDVFLDQLNNKSILNITLNNESYTDDVLLQALNWLDWVDDELVQDDHCEYLDNNLFSNEYTNSKLLADKKSDEKKTMQQVADSFLIERQLGWDLSAGIKSKTDIDKILEVHNLIKHSKLLQSVIRMIGRNKIENFNQKKITAYNNINSDGSRLDQGLPDEHSVNSVTGVCLGDDVSRMLSSELILLGNKNLKMLWHAKRAERQLLNYHYQGLLSDHVPDIKPLSIDIEMPSNQPIKNRGPLILCVDTSASMKGQPEITSKAIAFEVMRIAHLEKRECYLFCFSNTDEIIQLELNLDHGWKPILDFLSITFNGGTDVNSVMFKVLDKCNEARWKHADIILLSDGRFKVEDNLIHKVQNFKFRSKFKTRIFGLRLGKWNDRDLSAICHIVFDLSDV